MPVITKKYLSSTYCTKELYTADGDRKYIFPLMFEDVDFDTDQTAQGVKFTISGINWTMCRPDKDDYNTSISRLIQDMRNKGMLNELVLRASCIFHKTRWVLGCTQNHMHYTKLTLELPLFVCGL